MDESWPEAGFPDLPALRPDGRANGSAPPRDAAEIGRRAAEDEVAATDARARYRMEAPSKLEPDEFLAALLDRDEWLIAVRALAVLDRRAPRAGESTRAGDPAKAGLGGQFAVTSRRLILAGRRVLTFELAEVEEIVLSGDRLLLVMRDGRGVALDVEQPRLLRVQIAAARAAARI